MKGATFLEEKLSVLWWADEAYHQQKKINCWGRIQLDLSYSDILIILELWLHLMITLRLQVQWVILKLKLKWCQIVTVKQWQSNIQKQQRGKHILMVQQADDLNGNDMNQWPKDSSCLTFVDQMFDIHLLYSRGQHTVKNESNRRQREGKVVKLYS